MVARGTILNTITVAVGAGVGLLLGQSIPESYSSIVLTGLGLITLGLGLRLFLLSKNVLVVAASIALGGILGVALGFQSGIEAFGDWCRAFLGASDSGTFVEAVVAPSVLFCVGPMTLLGCLEDALEDKIDLLAVKSTMDGFAAMLFAVRLGPGVLVSAVVVLVVQGVITLLGARLKPFAENEELIQEASAAGGAMMMAIGIGLLELKKIPVANFLPALVLAPLFVLAGQKWRRTRGPALPTDTR